jgi:hypothetical protein
MSPAPHVPDENAMTTTPTHDDEEVPIMSSIRILRGRTAALPFGLALAAALAVAAPAAAHSQTVTPAGWDEPVVIGPISKGWAQAHCHAMSPSVVSGASNGVVVFTPAAALPCPANVTNPGGQVTGP